MTDAPQHPQQPATSARPKAMPRLGRDVKIGAACGLLVALMVGAAYASVPFYDWFCRATGFNGTTQVAGEAPQAKPLARTVAVRFDSNVSGGLPWKFEPEQTEIKVRVGEVTTVHYTITNEVAATTMGQAAYNVTPLTVGSYFTKINCFCFTEQTLAPGEKREMAVVFYVDQAFAADSENDGVDSITMSYTFFPVKNAAPKPVAANEPDRPGGSI